MTTETKDTKSAPLNLADLKEPFPVECVKFRAGATNKENTKAMALAYIDSRVIMDRLDNIVGPENWQDNYQPGPDGGVLCTLSIRVNGEWISKRDGASNTNFEAVKGGLADAFKRAAVKWGIGRYLYDLSAPWVSCQVRGKTIKLDEDDARQKVFGRGQNGHGNDLAALDKAQFFTKARQDFGLTNEQIADILKTSGFTGYRRPMAPKMYDALRQAV